MVILNDFFSLLLLAVFAYFFIFNFRRDNYAYAFVMFIGVLVFYGDFYHHLPTSGKQTLLLVACLCWGVFILLMGQRAMKQPARHKHFAYAVVVGILALIVTIVFRYIL